MYYVHNHDLSVTTKSNLSNATPYGLRSPETYMYAGTHTTHERAHRTMDACKKGMNRITLDSTTRPLQLLATCTS